MWAGAGKSRQLPNSKVLSALSCRQTSHKSLNQMQFVTLCLKVCAPMYAVYFSCGRPGRASVDEYSKQKR